MRQIQLTQLHEIKCLPREFLQQFVFETTILQLQLLAVVTEKAEYLCVVEAHKVVV